MSRVPKSALAAVLVAVLCVAVLEGLLRFAERWLSADASNIRRFPVAVQRLQQQPAPRFVFLGNSLARRGTNFNVFKSRLNDLGLRPPSTAGLYADDSTVTEWYYIVRKTFSASTLLPDALVIGFTGSQLSDQAHPNPVALGRYFAGASFAREAFRHDVVSGADRVKYVLSFVSVLYAKAERIRDQAFAFLVPNYRTSAQRLNQTNRADRLHPSRPTYHRLERLLSCIPAARTHVIVVAMPLLSKYDVPPALVETLRTAGATFIDLRHVDGLAVSGFLDDAFHLNENGARLFSAALAEALSREKQAAGQQPADTAGVLHVP